MNHKFDLKPLISMLTELNQFWGSYTVYTDIIINLSARELVVA